MPLVSLKTELKSLKYGRDRKGGGSSNQPYIKSPIPEQQLYSPKGLPPNPPDFLLRNGFLTPVNAAKDGSRLTQFLFDTKSINGYFFITKQNLQSRISVKTEASGGPGHLGGAFGQGVYLPTSTLAQSQIVYLGGHLNLFGLNPINGAAGSIGRYGDTVNAIKQSKEENRLVSLKHYKFENFSGFSEVPPRNKLFGYGGQDDNNLFDYSGGPNSILGIGKTTIRQSSYKTGEANDQIRDTFFTPVNETTKRFTFTPPDSGGIIFDKITPIPNTSLIPEEIEVSRLVGYKRFSAFERPIRDHNLLGYDKPGYPLGVSKIYENSKTLNIGGDSLKKYSYYGVDFKRFGFQPKIGIYAGGVSDSINQTAYNVNTPKRILHSLSPSWFRYSNIFKHNPKKSDLSRYDKLGVPLGVSYKFFKSKESGSGFSFDTFSKKNIVSLPRVWGSEGRELPVGNGGAWGVGFSSDSGSFENWRYNDIKDTVEKTTYAFSKSSGSYEDKYSKRLILQSERKYYEDKPSQFQASTLFNTLISSSISGSTKDSLINTTTDSLRFPEVNSIIINPDGSKKIETNNKVAGRNNTYYIPLEELDGVAKTTQDNKENHERKIINFISNKHYKTNNRTNLLTSASINQEYSDNNIIDSKYKMGNPGSLARKLGEGIKTTSLDEINSDNGIVDDIINFKIHHIEGKTIQFRAFLENFSDGYTANWNSYKYVGRADNFYTYESFDRQIALSFNVYAQSYNELPHIHGKLNYLASLTAPKYTDQGFMKGNIIKLTVGNYLNEVPGILKGVNYDINLESWDVDTNRKMPHLVKVSTFSFTPIHDFLPTVGGNFISWDEKK